MRVGHTRPVGTTWRMRLHSWGRKDRQPTLGDYVFEEPPEIKRGFLLVGVEETDKSTVYRATLERMDWEEFLAKVRAEDTDDEQVWSFTRDRR